jgi:hypothetical protein
MTPDDIRRFANRDWASIAAHKRDYWAEQYQEHGCAPARTASTALLLHMRSVQPDYPSAADREEDLQHHLLVRRRLDRVAHAFTRR